MIALFSILFIILVVNIVLLRFSATEGEIENW